MTRTVANEEEKDWSLAGITSSTGVLGRPLKSGVWYVPTKVWLEQDRLVWGRQSEIKQIVVSPRIFDGFVRLSDAEPDKILAYARRWGPIGFCEHDLPSTHNLQVLGPDRIGVGLCDPRGWPDHCWEPIQLWRKYSLQGRALLNIASRLNENKSGNQEDWKCLDCWEFPGTGVPLWQCRTVHQRTSVAFELNRWLEIGGVRLAVECFKHSYSISLQPPYHLGVFGAIACQLAFAIARADGLAICSGCGQAYTPTRRPTVDRRNYCIECGRSAAVRDASRDYRRRERERRDAIRRM